MELFLLGRNHFASVPDSARAGGLLLGLDNTGDLFLWAKGGETISEVAVKALNIKTNRRKSHDTRRMDSRVDVPHGRDILCHWGLLGKEREPEGEAACLYPLVSRRSMHGQHFGVYLAEGRRTMTAYLIILGILFFFFVQFIEGNLRKKCILDGTVLN